MDNAQKAIMIGVGLFITIIIISSVLLITNMGTDIIGQAGDEVTNMTDSLKNQLISQYQGKMLTEKQLLDLVKQYNNNASMGIDINYVNASGKATTLKLGAMTFTFSTNPPLTEADYRRANITATKVAAVAAASRKGYADAVAALTAGGTYVMAGVYNDVGQMVGLAAWQIR